VNSVHDQKIVEWLEEKITFFPSLQYSNTPADPGNGYLQKSQFWYNGAMNYLLYYIEGYFKKFPLNKPCVTIGRNSENDLVLREDFISRNHVQIKRGKDKDHIIVKDLKSTNGITFHDEKVKEALVKMGESFILGKMEFVLKKGSLDEFKLADEIIPIIDTIQEENEKKFENAKTRYLENIYSEILKVVMQKGMKKNNFKDFMLDLPNHLSNLTDYGSLFILSKQEEDVNISLAVKNETLKMKILKKVVKENREMFTREIISQPIPGTDARLYTYPLKNDKNNDETALLFILDRGKKKEEQKFEKFLPSLVSIIDLMSDLLVEKEKTIDMPESEEPSDMGEETINIVAENRRMKELIKQTKKIAGSDIFVLIQGESGTGKELFARLIHKSSRRARNNFVALNCAAIPENLLESELFGHEKGAFTDAHTQKKGKLEIASHGTLVFDEIGDMPINLQSKLLRALQEKEFYRLGGTTSITVDLRIISMTNQDLKRLITDGKFREDLYYRLVHRIITIPPLRERKEDISALINFFTKKFCQENNKIINGYSIKAFEALQDYVWKGNVRQLENEIHSIVNLTDDGETVGYDILSDEIKANEGGVAAVDKPFPGKVDIETEKAYILKLLEKNNWNKSKTARDLNMTYRGLHKKMQRLGIQSPGKGNTAASG
jgi:transcriptional regulator with GAF, ATPase, and Fis domain